MPALTGAFRPGGSSLAVAGAQDVTQVGHVVEGVGVFLVVAAHAGRLRRLQLHSGRCLQTLGGDDTVAFLNRLGMLARFGYVSTGGGAMLAYLAGERLPALEALKGSSAKCKAQSAKPTRQA